MLQMVVLKPSYKEVMKDLNISINEDICHYKPMNKNKGVLGLEYFHYRKIVRNLTYHKKTYALYLTISNKLYYLKIIEMEDFPY